MKNVVHVRLPDQMKQAAQVRAVQLQITVSEYVARLITADAKEAGVLHLFQGS